MLRIRLPDRRVEFKAYQSKPTGSCRLEDSMGRGYIGGTKKIFQTGSRRTSEIAKVRPQPGGAFNPSKNEQEE